MINLFLNTLLQLMLVIVLSLTFTGCSNDPEPGVGEPGLTQIGVTPTEILLGSSSALSGHAGFLGTQYTHGALAWFREVNANGGIHGRRINLISLDDQYDPPQTVVNTEKLINDKRVFMLFNYVGTPTSAKIISTVNDSQIPAFGFLTGAELLRSPFSPYLFHVRASYYSEAEAAVEYFVSHLGYTRIAVLYQDDAFGEAVLQGVKLAMRRHNLPIVATGTYTRGQLDVEDAVVSIQGSEAQAVVMAGTYGPLARFIKLCGDSDYQPYFHTVSFVGSEAFAEKIVAEGVDPIHYGQIIVTQVVPSPYEEKLPAVIDYRRLIAEHFPNDEPNYVALEGFINARVLSIALESAGPNLTHRKIKLMIERLRDVDIGIGKPVSFAPLDHSGLDQVFYSRLSKEGIFSGFELGSEN